eukprot:6461461-Alexandrium_andersonii.AAC.1
MSASLVGSEMCIRDSALTVDATPCADEPEYSNKPVVWITFKAAKHCSSAVSYTHLTLPTICSV